MSTFRAMLGSTCKYIGVAIALCVVASCAAARVPAPQKPPRASSPPARAAPTSAKLPERLPVVTDIAPDLDGAPETGLASYYHDSLAGRRTANGEAYRPEKRTCAHRSLPFNTLVEITTVDGKKAECRVNDRGPFVEGRVLDVSKRVAKELGMIASGIVEVQLRTTAPFEQPDG